MEKTVTIGGREYPCYPTMGAMLRYKRLTGREVNEGGGLSTSLEYMYCVVASACAAEGAELGMDCQQMCDRLSPGEFRRWTELMAAEGEGGDADAEKKTT